MGIKTNQYKTKQNTNFAYKNDRDFILPSSLAFHQQISEVSFNNILMIEIISDLIFTYININKKLFFIQCSQKLQEIFWYE